MRTNSIKFKIVFSVGILIFITTAALTIYSIINSRAQNINNAEKGLEVALELQASELQNKINKKFEILRTIRNTFLAQESNNDFSRETAIDILKLNLLANDEIIAMFSQIEPNALDYRDDLYANTDWYDKTGLFIPYIFKDKENNPIVVAIMLSEIVG